MFLTGRLTFDSSATHLHWSLVAILILLSGTIGAYAAIRFQRKKRNTLDPSIDDSEETDCDALFQEMDDDHDAALQNSRDDNEALMNRLADKVSAIMNDEETDGESEH